MIFSDSVVSLILFDLSTYVERCKVYRDNCIHIDNVDYDCVIHLSIVLFYVGNHSGRSNPEYRQGYKYKLEQNMTEFGLSSISAAFLNFSSNSTLPITLAAWIICLINSWSRRKTRIKLPSN